MTNSSTNNYADKLKTTRSITSSIAGRDFNQEMESDRGRAINSAAVRRLQQKTQVFPLEINAAVRSRLTHSLEVQQVGRHIAKNILEKLTAENRLTDFRLDGYTEGFITTIETACLLHDIGNPPFGHFGEKAINLWARDVLTTIFQKRFVSPEKYKKHITDLCSFEGNAQGIRVLHTIQSLNLTHTQLASLLKYTRCACEVFDHSTSNQFSYRHKKPGYYLSEAPLIAEINKTLSINKGCRFPLVYIMEAADDISYCIADIDDAIDKGILSVENVDKYIKDIWYKLYTEKNTKEKIEQKDRNYLPNLSAYALKGYHSESFDKNHAYILLLRTAFITDLCNYATERYLKNHQEIFHGKFDDSLLGGASKYYFAAETLRNIAIERVFCTPEVENMELKGYAAIAGLLNIYTPLLLMSYDDFNRLSQKNRLSTHPIETRLFHKLPAKYKQTYVRATSQKRDMNSQQQVEELYHRSRLVIDYISSMTDSFAIEEYRQLQAIE